MRTRLELGTEVIPAHFTMTTPSSWPIGEHVIWDFGGEEWLYRWTGDRWIRDQRVDHVSRS